MYQTDKDITYVQSTVHELEEYLLSDILFWPITGKGGKPLPVGETQLTIGNLLLSMKRLSAAGELSSRALSEATGLTGLVQRVRCQWKSNWDIKANAEINSRLTQWSHYLGEVASEPGWQHGNYSYNIRQRVILELLIGDVEMPLPTEQAYLASLDQRLRSITVPSKFVWNEKLKSGFPDQIFWFLYRKPV
jgi:hypothetical protein